MQSFRDALLWVSGVARAGMPGSGVRNAAGTITLADGTDKITAANADADVTLSAGATIAVTSGADSDVDIDAGGTISLTADTITGVGVEGLDTLVIDDTGAGAIAMTPAMPSKRAAMPVADEPPALMPPRMMIPLPAARSLAISAFTSARASSMVPE